MLHTKFHQNRHTGSWKEDFLSVYTIHGHGSHLGHVNEFSFLCTLKLTFKMVENSPVVSEKSNF